MTKKELVEKLNQFDDDLPVVLLDVTTDEESASTYSIREENIHEEVGYCYPDGSNEANEVGFAIVIEFENKLNENPI